MKKKMSAVLALSLAAAMMLGACGGSAPATNNNASTGKTSTAATASTPATDEKQTLDETEAWMTPTELPLTDEKVTITCFTTQDSNLTNLVDTLADTPMFQELEKRTNVHIDFNLPAVGNEASAYNLMIASGELPDLIKNSGAMGVQNYPDGLDAAVEDGYFLDLTDLAKEYAPHYIHALKDYGQYDKNVELSAYTKAGRMVGIYQIMKQPQGHWAGWYVREDWLKELGMDIPVTYDDWEAVLTAFKDQKGCSAPLLLANTAYDGLYNYWSQGFGVTSGFHQEGGKLIYGPAQEGWREYVTLMHDWYQKGLIDPDFMSAGWIPDQSMITTDKSGAYFGIYTQIAMLEAAAQDPNAVITAVPLPRKNAGDQLHFDNAVVLAGHMTVSAKTKYPELCVRLMDYMFSEEGSLLANYGIEGDTFEYVDGKPQFTEKITANPELSFAQAMAYYCMPGARCVWQDWSRELGAVPAKDIECYDIWQTGLDNANAVPAVENYDMTVEDRAEYAKIMTDVKSIVDERTVQFITGVLPLDQYDQYLADIKASGLDRAIELAQKGYDDFNAR